MNWLIDVKLGLGTGGLTVIMKDNDSPWQLSLLAEIFTFMIALILPFVLLFGVNAGILPVPPEGNPIKELEFVHVIVGLRVVLDNRILLTGTFSQYTESRTGLITGVGLTVTNSASVEVQLFPVVKVILYLTVTGLGVRLWRYSLMALEMPLVAGFSIPGTCNLTQLKFVFGVKLVAV